MVNLDKRACFSSIVSIAHVQFKSKKFCTTPLHQQNRKRPISRYDQGVPIPIYRKKFPSIKRICNNISSAFCTSEKAGSFRSSVRRERFTAPYFASSGMYIIWTQKRLKFRHDISCIAIDPA